MFNTDRDNTGRTLNSKLPPTNSINLNPTKPTKTTWDNSDRNKIQKNTTKNLLHQLDEQHPRLQDLVATNRCLINNAKKYASSNNGKLNDMTSRQTKPLKRQQTTTTTTPQVQDPFTRQTRYPRTPIVDPHLTIDSEN